MHPAATIAATKFAPVGSRSTRHPPSLRLTDTFVPPFPLETRQYKVADRYANTF